MITYFPLPHTHPYSLISINDHSKCQLPTYPYQPTIPHFTIPQLTSLQLPLPTINPRHIPTTAHLLTHSLTGLLIEGITHLQLCSTISDLTSTPTLTPIINQSPCPLLYQQSLQEAEHQPPLPWNFSPPQLPKSNHFGRPELKKPLCGISKRPKIQSLGGGGWDMVVMPD